MSADIPPNQTIYVNNLYEKLRKEELKKALHGIFSQFGKIIDIVCLKSNRLRGQAWIVFADVASATNAIKTMQGFPFFEKPMRLTYAKTKSDAIAKLEGTFNPRARPTAGKGGAAGGGAGARPATGQAGPSAPSASAPSTDNPPHKMLFVENLPHDTTAEMLTMLFRPFPGFVTVRMVPARPGIAFVDFDHEVNATTAKNGLDGFRLTEESGGMRVTYAKK